MNPYSVVNVEPLNHKGGGLDSGKLKIVHKISCLCSG